MTKFTVFGGLKACPFCGSHGNEFGSHDRFVEVLDDGSMNASVECQDCWLVVEFGNYPEKHSVEDVMETMKRQYNERK